MDEIVLKDGNRFVYNDMVEFVYDPFPDKIFLTRYWRALRSSILYF